VSSPEVKPDSTSEPKKKNPFSRRGFIQGAGVGTAAVGLLATPEEAAAQAAAVKALGPDTLPITLNVNGKPLKASVEPRETLLDTLRNKLDHTGAKRVCDRGTCGACTMIIDGKVMYSCTMLAIDAQSRQIQTIESLSAGKTHPIIPAFVNNDAQQCGYCTPGFVMASKGFLDKNPNPTYDQVKDGLGGNLCRCGTYVGIRKAVLEAAKSLRASSQVKETTNA
jgi:xanthine dehydrogenase YagT iron-sulfur-binding subunit